MKRATLQYTRRASEIEINAFGSCSWKKERNGHLFPSLVSNQKQIVVTNFRQSSRETEICSGRGGRGICLKRDAGVTSVNYDALLFSTLLMASSRSRARIEDPFNSSSCIVEIDFWLVGLEYPATDPLPIRSRKMSLI